jgi:hypothetical protein
VEGQSQTYILLHATKGTAQFLLQWLYTQRLDILQLRTKKYDIEESDSLVRLWILGDYLLIPQLQNCVIDSLLAVIHQFKFTPIHSLRYIYEHTSTDSKLRLLFLHRCCFLMVSSEFKVFSQEFPKEVSDGISSHSLPMRLVSVAALLRRYSPSPHPHLTLCSGRSVMFLFQ